MPNTFDLQVNIKGKNDAGTAVNELKRQVDGTKSSFDALTPAIQSAIGALSAYAGTRALSGVLNAYEEVAKQTAQAKFFLRAFTTDVDGALGTIQKYGQHLQSVSGISGDEFTVTTAKLAGRIGDVNKALTYANTLYKGQRLGLLNASDAANAMIRASEGNTRALRMLLEQMDIAVPAGASLETMFANLEARLKGLDDELSPFATQWSRLKEMWGDILEGSGSGVSKFLGNILKGILDIVEANPALQQTVGIFVVFGASVLALGGAFLALKPILGAIGAILGVAAFPVVALIGAIIMLGTVFSMLGISVGDAMTIVANRLKDPIGAAAELFDALTRDFGTGWAKIIVIATTAILAVGAAILVGAGGWVVLLVGFLAAIITAVATNWAAITAIFTEGIATTIQVWATFWTDMYENILKPALARSVEAWNGFWGMIGGILTLGLDYVKQAWSDTWTAVRDTAFAIWDAITAKIQTAVDFVMQKVAQAQQAWNNMVSLMAAPVSAVKGAATTVGNAFSNLGANLGLSGARADGGTVLGGRTYLVGERGAEFFTPSTSGRIIPNGAGAGGGSIVVNINGGTYLSENVANEIGNMIVDRLKRSTRIGL